jgi:glycosidase
MSTFLLGAALSLVAAGPPSVLKVDPPSWWPGHTINPVRLLVRGENLAGARLVSLRPDLRATDVRVSDKGTYLFASLAIDPKAPLGDAPLRLETDAGTARIPFQLLDPQEFAYPQGARGITQDDVVYLIMTDRFSSGDPSNDLPAGAPPETTDRKKSRGWHGGDFRGVTNHLPYLKELGVTAIWLTPWYDNFDGVYACDRPWCPYTYYHGYHAVDHYAVEGHFGTMAALRELVAKAHELGLKVIQDQVCNQISLHHPWVADPPLPGWFHGTPARHDTNPFLHEFVSSPHAPDVDRARVLSGWFSDDSPDLNQDEPEVARYLIQNALWWVGMTGIDGIREDTAQYLPRPFLRDLTGALHRQHPRLTIVGEALDTEPIHVSFFLGGKPGWDGIDTGLDSVFDFPTWAISAAAVAGKVPMTEIRRVLRADPLYADPARLTTLSNNHDNRRVVSWPGSSPALARLHLAFTLALRGIPQLYYGDEIAMPGEGDPDNRRDFPGGFPGDTRRAFEPSGRTPEEQQTYAWTRDWIALRRSHPAIRRGALIDLYANAHSYVFARRDPTETLVIALNRSDEPATAAFSPRAVDAKPGASLVPLLGGGEATSPIGDRITLKLPARSAVAYQLR